MVPSEGIEPPAEEPESSVLSITPRGLSKKTRKHVNRMNHVVHTRNIYFLSSFHTLLKISILFSIFNSD